MLQIKLDKTAMIIGVILIVGYFVIFMSVVKQSFTPYNSSNEDISSIRKEFQLQIASLQHSNDILTTKIKENGNVKIKENVIVEIQEKDIKKDGDITTHNSMTAYRPGVIILGMHRSGKLCKLSKNFYFRCLLSYVNIL